MRAAVFVQSAAAAFPERLFSLAILTRDAAYSYIARLVYSMVKDELKAAVFKNTRAIRRESLRLRRRMLAGERNLKSLVSQHRRQAKLDADIIYNLKAELLEQQQSHSLLAERVEQCEDSHDNRIYAVEQKTKMHGISISDAVVVTTFLMTEGTRVVGAVDAEIKSLRSTANDNRLVLDRLSVQVAKINRALESQDQQPSLGTKQSRTIFVNKRLQSTVANPWAQTPQQHIGSEFDYPDDPMDVDSDETLSNGSSSGDS
eukprot:jgi/Hompol1/5465/HPOL_004460-RA